VALARALVLEPRALLLDEPLAALDVQTRAAVRAELREVLEGLAIPTVLVTHDYADALVFRDRVVILVDGRVAQDGSHADLLAHPHTRFVADFTGVNFFEGQLQAPEPDQLARVLLPGGVTVFVAAEGLIAGPVSLGLRPWEITLSATPPGGSARNVLRGQVREVLPVGGRVRVTLAAGPDGTVPLVAEITLDAQTALACRQGQELSASFKATAVSVAPR
jgi:molybdopterin-binding protein